MQTIILDDRSGFKPRCFAAIASYDGPIFNERYSLPHPFGILGHSWTEVMVAFEFCLDALEKKRGAPVQPANQQLIDQTIATFRDVLYRSMEFFENLSGNVALTLSSDQNNRVKLTGSKRLREVVALPCNKLKHNHNRIHYVEAVSAGYTVPGFSIYHVVGGALQRNPQIHKDRRAISFNVELRRIFATIYLYGDEVAECISKMASATTPVPIALDERTITVIRRIVDLPLFAMPLESERHMPSVSFDGTRLSIRENGGLTFPAPRDCRMMAAFVGDGATKSFTVP